MTRLRFPLGVATPGPCADAARPTTATSSGSSASGASRRDGGFTIVENLMSIVLTGLIATSLFLAMWTLIRTTRVNEDRSQVDAVLGGAVDALASVDFRPCPGLDGYEPFAQQGAVSVGWPAASVQVTRIRYWDPLAGAWNDTNPLTVDQCAGVTFLSTARSMQLVEVTATAPDGTVSGVIETIVTDLRDRRVGNG